MRISGLLFAAAAFLPATPGLRAQPNQITCDSQNCAFPLSFDDPLNGPPPVITGAPYTGQVDRQQARTLPNGTHTNIQYSGPLTYRDSKGRLRTEESVYRNQTSDRPAPPDNFTVIEIRDPVAGYQYILDPISRVAHRMAFKPENIEAWKPGPLTPAGPSISHTDPGGTTWTNEPLGTKTISGVTTVGDRLTSTQTRGRGTQPFPVSNEYWNDPRTGVSLLSKHMDDTSEMTMTTLNYIAGDPDPSLFQIPEGYKVVDETGPFRVVHPRAGGSTSGGGPIDPGSPAILFAESDCTTWSVTFTPATGRAASMIDRAVTGAPYSGRETIIRTLPDGTEISTSATALRATYRDSEGRVRMDPAPTRGGPSRRPCEGKLALVEIQDPVGGYRYILDPVGRVAYRIPYQVSPQPYQVRGAGLNAAGLRALPDGTTVLDEYPAQKMISGVTAVGHRTTRTSPPGTYMGNDKPVVQINETWTDPQTGIVLLRKNSGPDGGNANSIPDYKSGDPDPALFKVPEGYKIVDETGKFTFVVPDRK